MRQHRSWSLTAKAKSLKLHVGGYFYCRKDIVVNLYFDFYGVSISGKSLIGVFGGYLSVSSAHQILMRWTDSADFFSCFLISYFSVIFYSLLSTLY